MPAAAAAAACPTHLTHLVERTSVATPLGHILSMFDFGDQEEKQHHEHVLTMPRILCGAHLDMEWVLLSLHMIQRCGNQI